MPDTQNTIEGWLQSALINEDQWKVTEESMAFSSLLTHNVRGGGVISSLNSNLKRTMDENIGFKLSH